MATRKITTHTPESLIERCDEEGECLIWSGYAYSGTVPQVSHQGKVVNARGLLSDLLNPKAAEKRKGRVYWIATCQTNLCVAPGHAKALTQQEHSEYMARIMHASASSRAIARAKLSKRRQGLSSEAIAEIRNSDEPSRVVAAKFGISKSSVTKYRRGDLGASANTNVWAGLLK